MPATYRIDLEHKVVLSTATGIMTFADMSSHQDAIRSDPDFHPQLRQLIDFTGSSGIVATSQEIRILADRSPFRGGSRRAFAVPTAEYFGLARMFFTLTDDHGVEQCVFYSLKEAKEWLGLDNASEESPPETQARPRL